ncbi:MAG: hypothetical protein ACI8RD_012957, partial [Bacillariaceae sp.]|jgi:hypothetical protein
VLQLVSSKYIDIIIDLGNNEIEKKNQMSERIEWLHVCFRIRTADRRSPQKKKETQERTKPEVRSFLCLFEI